MIRHPRQSIKLPVATANHISMRRLRRSVARAGHILRTIGRQSRDAACLCMSGSRNKAADEMKAPFEDPGGRRWINFQRSYLFNGLQTHYPEGIIPLAFSTRSL